MVASLRLTQGTAPCPSKTPYPLFIIGLTQEDIKNPDITEKEFVDWGIMHEY